MKRQIKLHVEVKLSRNFNTVTLGISDEPIEYEDSVEGSLSKKLRTLGEFLQSECEHRLDQIGAKK